MQTAVLTMFPGPGALSPAVAGALQEAAEPAGNGSTTFDAALSSASQGLAQEAGPTNPGQALPLASATPSHARAHAPRPGEAAPTAPERRAAADPSRPAQEREEAGAATSDQANASSSASDAQEPAKDLGSDSLAAWLATIVGSTQAVVPRAARPKAPAGEPADTSDTATVSRTVPANVSANAALQEGSRLVATPGGQGDARTIRSATHPSVSAAPQPSHPSHQDRTDASGRAAAAEIEPARAWHRLPEPTPEQVADPQAVDARSPRTVDAQSLRRDAQGLAEALGRQATLTPVEPALRGGPAVGRDPDTLATSPRAADTQGEVGSFTASTSAVPAVPSAPDAPAASATAAAFRPAAKGPGSTREPGPSLEAAAGAATARQPADAPASARVAAAPNPASQRQEPRAADQIPLVDAPAPSRSDNASASAAPLAAPATAPTQAAPQSAAAAAAAATPGLSAAMPAGLPAALVPLMASMTAQLGPAAGAPASPGRAAATGPLPAEPSRSPRNAAAAAVLTDATTSLRVTPQDPAVSGAPPVPVGAWMQALEAAIQTVSPPEGPTGVREPLAPPGGSSPPAAQVSANAESPREALQTESRIDAALQSPEFAPMLGARVTTLVREGVEQARIALNPAEMGPVSVQLELSGSQVRVELAAEVEATRLALEQALPTLAGSLREAGFTLAGGGVFQQARDGGASGRDAGHGTAGEAAAATARTFDLSEAARPAANTGRPRGLVDLYA